MKKYLNSTCIILVCLLGLALTACQKEEILNDNQLPSVANTKVAPAPAGTSALSEYLSDLSGQIEAMVAEGTLRKGNGNSLIAKITNTIKSIEKGNTSAINGQLNAFINETESYVDQNLLSIEQGQTLIDAAENGIFVSNGKFTDARDGHIYPVVLIGDQIWMAENLAYLPAVSPSNVGSGINPHYYVYGYQGTNVAEAKATANYSTYGVLYNWSSAKSSCPAGWHLPSDAEWHEMILSLDPDAAYSIYNTESYIAGAKLKEAGTSHWSFPNDDATNVSGFTALPGGAMASGTFDFIHGDGHFWSSTQFDSNNAWLRFISNGTPGVVRIKYWKSSGLSVRCIKDK